MISDAIQMFASDADHCAGVWRNIVVVVWRKETMVDAVRIIETNILRKQRAHPAGIGLLIVIERGASLPSDRAREAIAEMIGKVDAGLVGCGYVFEGEGFASAAVRYVIIGLTMLTRPRYAYTIVKSVDEVALWMVERIKGREQRVSAEEIEHAVARIRQL